MKDPQADQSGQFTRIPFLSTALHCVAMTVLVFLRSSFGYLYLRPRTLLFASGWAMILFSIYAWMTPSEWREYRAICIFGTVATSLYALHFAFCMLQQTRDKAAHDQHSGTSHLSRIFKTGKSNRSAVVLHLWIEPILVLIAAAAFWWRGTPRLPQWLIFAAICVFAAELTNYWLTVRRRKRQGDIFADAEDATEPGGDGLDIPPPKATRRPPRKRGGSSA